MSDKQSISPQSTNPAVSVIIPMYNAIEYIGECLDSLLAQTFKDFEVIIADDCSTDNSVAIVESYMPKFNGRLKLTHTETNSGGCAVPRNVGFPLARGEYVFFMDSDDALTKTGLEEMYTLAKEYDADVVYCERYYMSTGIGEEFVKNMHVATRKVQKPPYVDKPTLESQDLSERVQAILKERFYGTAWLKLVRHDLLKEHKILFSLLKPGEDDIWNYRLIFFSKNILRVPNTVYVRRMREDSIMGTKRTPKQALNFWLNPLLLGLKELDELMSQIEFFQENPQQRYAILEKHFQIKLKSSLRNTEQLSSIDVYEAIKDKFGDKLGEYDVLISALCTHIFGQDKTLKEIQKEIKRTENVTQEAGNYMAEKDTEIKRLKEHISFILDLRQTCPEISVIIPMYNAEKYIGECLDSVLLQTFRDFEVIVVDDCSTDNSVAVVNNYMSKFGGRLKLAKTKKNSSSPAEPGNIGVALSRGNYLFFLDNDDEIIPDALEKLYTTAKEFNADVVACERYSNVPEDRWNDVEFRHKLTPTTYKGTRTVNKPTLIPFDIAKRVQLCSEERFLWPLWSKLIRRDCLISNQIRFQNTLIQDMLATCCLAYTAEKFVCVPYIINIYRMRSSSLYRQKREPLQKMQTYMNALNVGFKYLDTFLSNIEFFQKNPKVKQAALKVYFRENWDKYIREVYDKIPLHDREEALRKEFNDSNNTLLMAFLFDVFFDKEKENSIPLGFDPFITARADIHLQPKNPTDDTQIFSVSANETNFLKSSRTKNGMVYQIHSHAGKMEIVVKVAVEGKIKFWLRGLDIRDSKDKSKRIPYWIDYTKLIVDGKNIFNKIIPVWHDKPYVYNMEVKAGAEIKIQVEWLPHRSDIIESKIVFPPPTFAPFITARLDAKLMSKTGDFQILSLSDDNATMTKPAWFQKKGVGYVINSYVGKLDLNAKATSDGQINLKLRSLDVVDSKNKRIPYWIDYTKLIVNGETIFDTPTPAWHGKPYAYSFKTKADEEIKIQVEWLPHRSDTIDESKEVPPEVAPPESKEVPPEVAPPESKEVPPEVAPTESKEVLPEVAPTESKEVPPPPKVIAPQFKFKTARIDAKLVSETGDFQILSLSDDNATMTKPAWFQKKGVGYVINSYVGKLDLNAKATSDGQINLKLRSLDVVDSKNKRIPYWIDYTKLIVNGETIFDTPTPAWHGKPYAYGFKTKAGEEIKIQIEWQPHRSDT